MMTDRNTMQRLAKHGFALAIMVAGAFLVFTVVMGMNKPPAKKKQVKRGFVAQLKVKKRKKNKTRKIVRKKRRPKAVKRQTRRAPPPAVATNLAGIDVGLPSSDPSGFGNLTSSLVDSTKALGDVVMDQSSVDTPPVPVQQSMPTFPARARAQGLNGFVKIKLVVDASGAVAHVEVLTSSHKIFERAALTVARTWRFRPAQYKGRSVKMSTTQTVRFNLG